jgi:hypothetical protein
MSFAAQAIIITPRKERGQQNTTISMVKPERVAIRPV